MNCKKCGKELDGELELCQDCAKLQEEVQTEVELQVTQPEQMMEAPEETVEELSEKDTKKAPRYEKKGGATVTGTVSLWKIVAATVVVVLLLIVLVGAMIYGITGELPYNLGAKETTGAANTGTDPAASTAAIGTAEDLGMTIEGLTDIALYTGDDTAAAGAADEVVAQLGDYTLTNGQLQIFYWMEFSNFVLQAAENGYDLANTYNLDITKPLAEQKMSGYDVTWEQFFLHSALGTWCKYAGVNTLADRAGFDISDADKESLASVSTQLEADAQENGFESVEALIKDRLGASCDLEDYMHYMEFTARGDLYYTEYQKTYNPTEEEVKEFFELNGDYYSYYGITLESGKLVDVRHVLLVPEGATTDASTGYITATDEQWAAGEAAAQAMLDAWVAAGATEEGFAQMANEHSTDGGSNTNGGLYEGVSTGQMVEAFDAWIFDAARKPGDYGIVKTEFGHHLMYFVAHSEHDAWYEYAYKDAITYGYGFNQELAAFMEEAPMTPVLDKIVLSDVAQEAAAEESTDPTEAGTPTAATE